MSRSPAPSDGPHYLQHRRRLRERFRQAGGQALAEYELLELLLTYAIPRRDVKPLAKDLLARFGSLRRVLGAETEELLAVPGLGEHSVALLLLAREVGARCLEEEVRELPCISGPDDVADYVRARLGHEKREVLLALFLDQAGRLLGSRVIQEGALDRLRVYPRNLMEEALKLRATGIIIAHNHPGGSPKPSVEDIRLTQDLAAAAGLLEIKLRDHLIVGDGPPCSLRANGLLPK